MRNTVYKIWLKQTIDSSKTAPYELILQVLCCFGCKIFVSFNLGERSLDFVEIYWILLGDKNK